MKTAQNVSLDPRIWASARRLPNVLHEKKATDGRAIDRRSVAVLVKVVHNLTEHAVALRVPVHHVELFEVDAAYLQ